MRRTIRRFWRPNVDADVDDELRFHLVARAAELIADGRTPHDAERLARARFGDVDRVRDWLRAHDHDQQRRARRAESMETLVQDVRYAARALWQRPTFAATVVLVLALGIGATTAMFSAVDAALLRPLPFAHDDRLVLLERVDIPTREFMRPGVPKHMPAIDDVRAARTVFTHVAAYAPGGLNLTGGDEPVRVRVALVTGDFFATIGRMPARGRAFAPDETTPDGPRAAILSDALWRRQFGGDASIVGRTVRLNDVPHRIVGIMPRGIGFPSETELYLPLTEPMSFTRWDPFRQFMPSRVIARLAPGVSSHAAGERMRAMLAPYVPDSVMRDPGFGADSLAMPLRDVLVGARREPLLVLFGATTLVLLVACANAANLLLSRAATRRAEIALRAALGATRRRLVRQLLVESVLLAVVGALLGVVLAYAGLGALGALLPPTLAGTAPARIDARVLAFSLGVALLTGIAFGLWPALGASRADAGATVKQSAGGSTAREASHARRAFVVAELALALMLAVGAGLMLRSFDALISTDIGVRADHAATLELSLPKSRYRRGADRVRFFDAVLARLEAMPGIQAAGFVNNLPLSENRGIGLWPTAIGRPAPRDEENAFVMQNIASPGYFRAAGIAMHRGRTLIAHADSTRRGEIVIDERMARLYWPGEDALDKLVAFDRDTLVVVGIVGDVHTRSLERAPDAQMYLELDRSPLQNAALVVRGTISPDVLTRRMIEAVRAVDSTQAVFNARPMADVIAQSVAPRRANTLLIALFGVAALVLAAVGVYGVIAFAVAQRTREIGIRLALGAQRHDVMRLMLDEGLVLTLIGVVLGIAGAWALRRVMASLVYGITPADPVSFVIAPIVLLAIALAATFIPARAATRVDPARTIRAD